MKTKYSLTLFMLVGFLTACPVNSYAENIDPNEDGSQYAYGENVGWINFEPSLCVTGVL